ncbi:Aste57867_21820 [Aphanomyces stellatus]|uniref:Aste57867_21820 protein n=1 Tax=Aphanomyces stellatus TaxID=120398 RepID=A0A485LJS5_9STRA|nr:hypothetical protein As57867_021751 [Aphanomyces stellatus]VFT98489.1 Aste57867_21820 [Aphanomyces stellatus]
MVSFRAFATTASMLATTVQAGYTGLSSTYGGPQGVDASTGNCGPMAALPSATMYHVAMNDPQYNTGLNCGRCVSIQCTDPRCKSNKVMMAQVTDRCPECKSGDLDMTLPLFQELTGYQTDKYAISWSFVDCPVNGGIQVCAKDGSSKFWLYVQPMNTVSGVRSMKINGGSADPFPSNYYFMATSLGVELGQTHVEMTSWAGETIKTTVSLTAGGCTQIPQQFTKGLPTSDGGAPAPAPSSNNPPPTTPVVTTATPTTTTAPPTTTAAPTTTFPPTTTTAAPTTTTATPTTTTVTPEPTTTSAYNFTTEATNSSLVSSVDASATNHSSSDRTVSSADEATTAVPASATGSDAIATSASGPPTTATPINKSGEVVVNVKSQQESSNDTTYYILAGAGGAFCLAVAAVLFVVKKSRENYMNEKESDMVDGQLARFGESNTGRNKIDSDVVIL